MLGLIAVLDVLGPPVLLPIVRYSTNWAVSSHTRRHNGERHNAVTKISPFWSFWQPKPTASEFLEDECSFLHHAYSHLIDPMMSLWNESGFSIDLLEHTSGDKVYIVDGEVLLSGSTTWGRTIPTFVRYIQQIAKAVQLPNMLLPLNPADEPLAELKPGEPPRPLLAFCKIPGYSDVLLPNTAEGEAPTRQGVNKHQFVDDYVPCTHTKLYKSLYSKSLHLRNVLVGLHSMLNVNDVGFAYGISAQTYAHDSLWQATPAWPALHLARLSKCCVPQCCSAALHRYGCLMYAPKQAQYMPTSCCSSCRMI